MTAPASLETASPTLSRVLAGGLCAGCGGCAAAAPGCIEIETSAAGFLRPKQLGPISEDHERTIADICPGVQLRAPSGDGAQSHELWGPWVSARSGWATSDDLRFEASSGGALSGILLHLLDCGEVDAVLNIAADDDDPVANRVVICETEAQLLASAGSRYAPSAPLAAIAPLLDEDDRRFAFVGKPCDVAALRALGEKDPRIGARFPIAISFFCAGAPSLHGGAAVLGALCDAPEKVTSFRYRGRGWPGFAQATLSDGAAPRMTYAESWGGILSGVVQLRCRICPDGTGHFADIVCADAWETDAQGYPLFEERDGVSLIVARNARGEAIVRAAMAAGHIAADDFEIERLRAIQPGQVGKRTLLLPRLLGLRLLMRPTPRYRGFPIWRNALRAGVRPFLTNFAGIVRRTLKGRLRH